jgi:hypothetical protein
MFKDCSLLSSLPLSFDLPQGPITTLSGWVCFEMFFGCASLTSDEPCEALHIPYVNGVSTANFWGMFAGCPVGIYSPTPGSIVDVHRG